VRRALALSVLAALAVQLVGCAMLGDGPDGGETGDSESAGMTQHEMEIVFAGQVEKIEGPTGAIRTQIDNFNVYLVSDVSFDRMQILMPIARTDGLDRRVFNVLLEANFQKTLDARYAVSEGVVYGIYLHPISTLTPAMIRSALEQVVNLGRTYGTTFSSQTQPFGVAPERGR
jgi:hypothetical protein